MVFAHLQISTAYSLLSSTISIPALVEKAKKLQYSALAITDHNALYGVLPFYKSCIKANIKPLIGMTADVETGNGDISHPLVLLAKNNEGYKNLLKISSAIKTKSEETISINWLKAYSSGLIALTPGQEGEIEQLLLQGKKEEAEAAAEKYTDIFGKNAFYISLQDHGSANAESLLQELQTLSQKMDIPLIATNDVRYLDKADSFAYECLIALREGEKLSDLKDPDESEKHLKSQQEMVELFSRLPEALENTLKIAENCNVMIETNQELLPKYPLNKGETASSTLRDLCLAGLTERISRPDERYMERLDFELEVIGRMGFNDYFLIVWDFMKYAREQGILTGPGRGSAAGSLVAYVLGITDVNPIEHGLLFERFLNPERVNLPDIDIDFPDHRRDEVIEYVMNKYGKLHVAQIITFGTFAAKAAIRDTARVFGLGTKEMDQLSRLISSNDLQQAYKESASLRDFIGGSEKHQKLYETALKLEGLPRHTSTHAAGVVITEQPLIQLIPIQGGETGTYLTQFPMEDLEEIGLLKMDFLGLRNLSLLERVVKSIEIGTGNKIDLKKIPRKDEKSFAMLQRGETTGIFQLESEGMRKVLRELKPTEFEDIVAVNALFRPGPMENIPDYIARKHGKKTVEFSHPDLKAILQLTYGVIVYQEQIMQIASTMAGFSLGEADLLRRAVSKKKRDVLDHERKHFVNGALKKGYNEKVANETYDLIVRFANYGFNRSHAVAYSIISWELSFLKAQYPNYFMAALLTSAIGNEEKIAKYIAEAKHMGIDILPPSIQSSHFPFIAEKSGIRYSLAAIRGIGASTLRAIIEARKSRPFKDLFDFCMRVPQKAINRKVLESLVHSGAFDEFGYDRAVLLATIDVALEHAELMRPADADLFEDEEMFQIKPKYIDVEPIGLADKLYFEKQATGIYISDHPVSSYVKTFQSAGVIPILELKPGQRNVASGVYIASVKTIRTKKGDVMAFVSVNDASGDIEGVVFPDIFRRFSAVCKEGEIVLITGNIENRDGHAQFIIQRIEAAEELEFKRKSEKVTLYLKIPIEMHNRERLLQLREILSKYTGTTAVVLHYESNKQTIKLSNKDRIDPSAECLGDLAKLLGEVNVILK
ncbi:DNA polymerase III subunit alpha [Lederbergia citrea]|uniref:DNA polymerase III subunit alpha n=1 Tax=Lederbergia citrea TaxID=2833581 RepID=A0A942Z3M5_9BACI|nr:DNA polymerase III subunit alpha [Lederbergia citrea]MBS4222719.1 DNA polymerase III subunit alpha [Lederbergia citrea]